MVRKIVGPKPKECVCRHAKCVSYCETGGADRKNSIAFLTCSSAMRGGEPVAVTRINHQFHRSCRLCAKLHKRSSHLHIGCRRRQCCPDLPQPATAVSLSRQRGRWERCGCRAPANLPAFCHPEIRESCHLRAADLPGDSRASRQRLRAKRRRETRVSESATDRSRWPRCWCCTGTERARIRDSPANQFVDSAHHIVCQHVNGVAILRSTHIRLTQ